MRYRLAIDYSTQWSFAFARIAAWHRARLGGKAPNEFVRYRCHNNDSLGRHTDLTLIQEGAKSGRLHGLIQIGILQHEQRRLAAQLQEHRFEVFCRALGNDSAHAGRTGKIDSPDSGMINQCADHPVRIFRRVRHQVDNSLAQTSGNEALNNQRMGSWATFRGLEHHGVSACQWSCNGTRSKNNGCIPRCNPEHDSRRLTNRQRETAWFIGRDYLATDLRGEGSSLAYHIYC